MSEYASHTDEDGFTIESNSATAEQLAERHAPVEAPPAEGETPAEGESAADAKPGEDAPDAKLTPFRKGTKPSHDYYKRMQQATAQLAEERRKREAAEKRATELEARVREREAAPVAPPPQTPAPTTPAPVQGAKFPSYDVWLESHPDGSWDDWQDEKIDWRAEQKLTATEHQRRDAKILEAHLARMANVATKYPDFQQVREKADATLAAAGINNFPDVLVRAVIQSDRSDDLIYFLGTHPEEAVQLARDAAAAPLSVAPLLQRMLETQLSTNGARSALPTGSGPPARSLAKPPVNPVGGTATVQSPPLDELEFGPEYVRRMNKRDRERGKW
jgi:hypothetical protein